MGRAEAEHRPSGWAGELACLFQRLKMTSGRDPTTGKPLSLRQIARRSGYVPSHVRDVINGAGRPSRDAVVAVAGALNASEEDLRLAAFYAEQLKRSPVERRVERAHPGGLHPGRGISGDEGPFSYRGEPSPTRPSPESDGGSTFDGELVGPSPGALTGRDAELDQVRILVREAARPAGDETPSGWRWTLSADPEAIRHWLPRARGVGIDSEQGYRFRGRAAALQLIVGWLDRPRSDRRVLVITGSPGAGKSAVLGRVVTTADARTRTVLPSDDDAVRARLGSVACAVHAKGKTALDVAGEIARAASAPPPERADDLAPALRRALEERRGHRFNVVIDALDEAASPTQTREIATGVVLPVAQTCAEVGAQVLLATRRRDRDGDLVAAFAGGADIVDLDADHFFIDADLVAYARATLQLAGDERPDSPYADEAVAEPVAARIAELSERNFLIAGLTARFHGLHDARPADVGRLALAPTVDAALGSYLGALAPVGGQSAQSVLTALAYADMQGMPIDVWRLTLDALQTPVSERDLIRFTRSSAGCFLVESADGSSRVFRLFHHALNEALLRVREEVGLRSADERALAEGLIAYGRAAGWTSSIGYLLRALPAHADLAGLIDELLRDDDYLLHADLRSVTPFVDSARSREGRGRARLLQWIPQAIVATPDERVALFSVAQAMHGNGSRFAPHRSAPYRARWAAVAGREERMALDGHIGSVYAVCSITTAGRTLLASAGIDRTVRLWDPLTGELQRVLEGHTDSVRGVCSITTAGHTLLATTGIDRTVRLWDPLTGELQHILEGHTDSVYGVCSVTTAGHTLLATAGIDRTVRLWDPLTGELQHILEDHTDSVYGVCSITTAGHTLLASACADGTIRLWDPASDRAQRIIHGHTGAVRSVCSVEAAGRVELASASVDGTVRLWDPLTGELQRVLKGHTDSVYGVCSISTAGRTLLATAGIDGTVRLWDPTGDRVQRIIGENTDSARGVCSLDVHGRDLLASAGGDGAVRLWDPTASQPDHVVTGLLNSVRAVCSITVTGRTLLASGGDDATVRTWDPATGQPHYVLHGHTGSIQALCSVVVAGHTLLVSAGIDGEVRLWNPATGQLNRVLQGHMDCVRAVCSVTVAGRTMLASGGDDGTLRTWDPATGQPRHVLHGHTGSIHALCSVVVAGHTLLASAGIDGEVRLWDPRVGRPHGILDGHARWVTAVCPVIISGRTLLASASNDRTVRIWDPATGQRQGVLEGHAGWVTAVCPVTLAGSTLLASASNDRTVRIWDPANGACLLSVPVHHGALACAEVVGLLALGLDAGVITIELDDRIVRAHS